MCNQVRGGKHEAKRVEKQKKQSYCLSTFFPPHVPQCSSPFGLHKWKMKISIVSVFDFLVDKKKLKQIYKTSILQDERRKQNEKLRNYKEKHSKIQKTWTSALLQLLHKCNKTKVKIRNKKQKKNKRKTINNMNPSEINIII